MRREFLCIGMSFEAELREQQSHAVEYMHELAFAKSHEKALFRKIAQTRWRQQLTAQHPRGWLRWVGPSRSRTEKQKSHCPNRPRRRLRHNHA